jgi:hypothetical protein
MNNFKIFTSAFFLLIVFFISGCTNLGALVSEVLIPTSQAWVDNRKVEYITTDISDYTMAQAGGVNYVPRLKDAIGAPKTILERVYKFPNSEQISIFQSGPHPVGSANLDRSYSPMWRMVLVTWNTPSLGREFHSEEELLVAQDEDLISLNITDIVVNCPIVKDLADMTSTSSKKL